MNDKESLLKHMEELQEEIMWEEKLRRIFLEQDYGGQLCIRIPRSIARHAMSVREQEDRRQGINFPLTRRYHYKTLISG